MRNATAIAPSRSRCFKLTDARTAEGKRPDELAGYGRLKWCSVLPKGADCTSASVAVKPPANICARVELTTNRKRKSVVKSRPPKRSRSAKIFFKRGQSRVEKLFGRFEQRLGTDARDTNTRIPRTNRQAARNEWLELPAKTADCEDGRGSEKGRLDDRSADVRSAKIRVIRGSSRFQNTRLRHLRLAFGRVNDCEMSRFPQEHAAAIPGFETRCGVNGDGWGIGGVHGQH